MTAPDEAVAAAQRVELLEALGGCGTPGAGAAAALGWLGRHANVAHAGCVVRDAAGRLELASAFGLGPERVSALVRALAAEARDPLEAALAAPGPTHLPAATLPAGRAGAWLVPFGAGALLLPGGAGEPPPEAAVWAAQQLGARLEAVGGAALGSPERALLDALAEPCVLADADGRLVVANARARALLEAGPELPEPRRRAAELNALLLAAALAGGNDGPAPRRRELPLCDPEQGTDLLFELVTSPAALPGGRRGTACLLRRAGEGAVLAATRERDAALQKSQQETRSERLRLDLILDSLADPLVLTDAHGAPLLMNGPAERLLAPLSHADEPSARRARDNAAALEAFVHGLLATPSARRRRGELALTHPQTGGPLPMEAVSGKVVDETAGLTGTVTLLHDRTEALEKARLYEELKHASDELEAKVASATHELYEQNERLRRQAIELERASAAKSQFLANMSHEFRTPLNAILGYTSMLLQGVSGELTASQRRNLTRIDSNGRHLLEVINEILDITRIEAGRMPLHLSDFHVQDLLQEVLSELDPIIGRSPVKVTTQLGPRLPVVHSDRQKVKQIVLNLLSNALKFTHAGTVSVSAAYQPATGHVQVSVVDTGIGIAPEDREKIFDDFQQVDSSPTRAYGGTGLGLSICRRLATMIGGHISLESTLGQGSTFTLNFPRRPRRS